MRLVLTLPACTGSLEPLSEFLRAQGLGILEELVVNELVTNAIVHGRARCFRVRMGSGCKRVWLLDDGMPFHPLEGPVRPMGEMREGGYGMAIVHKVARGLRYSRKGGWNCLTLEFGEVER
jgi:anti-sigma regulatory factor (Ser/Thr protein kinase)